MLALWSWVSLLPYFASLETRILISTGKKNENENGVIQARFMKLKRGILTWCGRENEFNFLGSECYGMIVFGWKSKRAIEVELGSKILIGKN